MSAPILLLVEDDETLGTSLQQRLDLEGFQVRWARSARQADNLLGTLSPDIILSDIRLPDGDGETVMRRHFERIGMVPMLFMTAYGDIDQAVRLVREGALDYVTKPFDLDRLVESLHDIAARGLPARSANAGDHPFGRSEPMRKVVDLLQRAAGIDLPVLLLGETGTGKEVAARYLHDNGPRAALPFVPVNCGALPGEMIDSMLFGHERGAFTGAIGTHRGFMEEAAAGTLFLDEVGDLPLALQVKLLRVLEAREFRRLGATTALPFRARVVCATNRDLEAMVADGAFREDLWFRINVVTCRLPPLRERPDDIGDFLIRRASAGVGSGNRPGPVVSAEALAAARRHGWPGNMRELINRLDRAIALNDGGEIGPQDLFPEKTATPSAMPVEQPETLSDAREAAERHQIEITLQRTGGAVAEAAAALGVSRTTLWEKMKRYGIRADG
jgi:DNA-binding NtrC family response regulator